MTEHGARSRPVSEKSAEEVAEEAPAVPTAGDEPPVVAAGPATAPEPAPPISPQVDTENVAVVVDRAQQDAEIDHLIEVLVEEPRRCLPRKWRSSSPHPLHTRRRPRRRPHPRHPPSCRPRSTSKPPAEQTAGAEPPAAEGPVPEHSASVTSRAGAEARPAAHPEPERASRLRGAGRARCSARPRDQAHARGRSRARPVQQPLGQRSSRRRLASLPRPQPARSVSHEPTCPPRDARAAQPERPRATVASAKPDDVPAHELVAPVEMWFGDDRVGVKPGSRTYDLFQKYATVLSGRSAALQKLDTRLAVLAHVVGDVVR